MIFLQGDVYVKRDIKFEDIKPRLLGHWGTCPGLTLVYSHLNILIREHDLDMIYVVGPGHGAPSILANLWLEGSLEKFYSEYTRDAKGLTKLIGGFSTTGGFAQSHQRRNAWCHPRRWRAWVCFVCLIRSRHGQA
jgi:xylulose-5-phosphate/fructose-6-phosphate phosphoketolase